MHGDHQGAVVMQFVSISSRAASRSGASVKVLAFITPALFTSRLTSGHCRAASATCAGSVMSSRTGVAPGSVTAAGFRAVP
jgi:hypothetical protein